jgi:hypothetical protein
MSKSSKGKAARKRVAGDAAPKKGRWKPLRGRPRSRNHTAFDLYVFASPSGDVIAGWVEQISDSSAVYPYRLGERLGAYRDMKSARKAVEKRVHDLSVFGTPLSPEERQQAMEMFNG